MALGALDDAFEVHFAEFRLGLREPDDGLEGDAGNRHEIGLIEVSALAENVDRQCRIGQDADRVAVGLRLLGDIGVADNAGTAGSILDTELEAGHALHLGCKGTGGDVHAAAGG